MKFRAQASTYVVAAVTLLIGIELASAKMPPTKRYIRGMEAALEAERDLGVCRAQNGTEWLKDVRCFEEALAKAPFNASWSKQAGALCLMGSFMRLAARHFNDSAQTIAEANGFLSRKADNSGTILSVYNQVKLYYAREKAGGIEFAKAQFQALQMQGRLTEARHIVDDFLPATHDPLVASDLLRNLGDFVAAVRNDRAAGVVGQEKRTTPSLLASVVEEVPYAVEAAVSRWFVVGAFGSPQGVNETLTDLRVRCRYHVASAVIRPEYTLSSLVDYAQGCLRVANVSARHEANRTALVSTYMALSRTVLHEAAYIGLRQVVYDLLKSAPESASITDNLGRTVLHSAAAGHQVGLLLALSKDFSLDLRKKDGGGVTPLSIICGGVSRAAFENASPKACTGLTTEFEAKIIDDESDDVDVSGGGWATTIRGGVDAEDDRARCPRIDARAADGIPHQELIGRYLGSGTPVVLRSVPRRIQKALTTSAVQSSTQYKDVLMRRESFPQSERYGVPCDSSSVVSPPGNVSQGSCTSILGAIANASRSRSKKGSSAAASSSPTARGTWHSVECPSRHPFNKLLSWLPKSLVRAGGRQKAEAEEDLGYTKVHSNHHPVLLIGEHAVDASTNDVIHDRMMVTGVVHGHLQVSLRPPRTAMTTQRRSLFNVTLDSADGIRCVLQPGDILVVPPLWSTAMRPFGGDVVLFQRRVSWR